MADERIPTILIVEDNEDNRLIYSAYLEHAGLIVMEAADGHAGLACAQRDLPDLVIMDVSLPGLDGLEVTRRLKSDANTNRIPVLVVTAHAMLGDRDSAINAGADRYLTKPVEPRAVLDAVRELLTERGLMPSPPPA